MSSNPCFTKQTAMIIICVVALIIIRQCLETDFRKFSLRPSRFVRTTDESSNLQTNGLPTNRDKNLKYLTVYNLTKKSVGNYRCVTMTVVPPTKVCLHELKRDVWVSKVIVKDGAWERGTLSEFKDELLKDNKLGVFDIGANIGVYTLYAATMGRKVVAVEPFMENIKRLHKAAILGGVGHNIVLLQNAVADRRDEGMLQLHSFNQGMTSVINKTDCNRKTCPPTVKTILLSDLRQITPFDRAIMKIDIQGFEPRAFSTIEPLLDQISIPTIFMEWEFFHPGYKKQLDHERVQRMIDVLTKRGYQPYRLRENNGLPLNLRDHQSWPYNIVWRIKSN